MRVSDTRVDSHSVHRTQNGDVRDVAYQLGGRLNRRPMYARDHLHESNALRPRPVQSSEGGFNFNDISLPWPSPNHTNTNRSSSEYIQASNPASPASSRQITKNCGQTRWSTPSRPQSKETDLSSSGGGNTLRMRVASTESPPCTRNKRDLPDANGTYLHHLDIGDVGSPRDMAPRAPDASQVESLQTHDFAFVLRRNGQWTYAILAGRREGGALLFVVDSIGSVKRISRTRWAKLVRTVKKAAANDFNSSEDTAAGSSSPTSSPSTPKSILKTSSYQRDASTGATPIQPLRQSITSIGALSLFEEAEEPVWIDLHRSAKNCLNAINKTG